MNRRQRPVCETKKEDWSRCMDGFYTSQRSTSPSKENSVPSISWNSSDDEIEPEDQHQENASVGNSTSSRSVRNNYTDTFSNKEPSRSTDALVDTTVSNQYVEKFYHQRSIEEWQSPQESKTDNKDYKKSGAIYGNCEGKSQSRKNLNKPFSQYEISLPKGKQSNAVNLKGNSLLGKRFCIADPVDNEEPHVVKSKRRLLIEQGQLEKCGQANLDNNNHSCWGFTKSSAGSHRATKSNFESNVSINDTLQPVNLERCNTYKPANISTGTAETIVVQTTHESMGGTVDWEVEIETIASQPSYSLENRTYSLRADSPVVNAQEIGSQTVAARDSADVFDHSCCPEPDCQLCLLLKPVDVKECEERIIDEESRSPVISQTSPIRKFTYDVHLQVSQCVEPKSTCKTNLTKPRISDWVQSAKEALLTTSRKSGPEVEEEEESSLVDVYQKADSAKKKKQKYVKDGLADRLGRLTAREKSAQAVWLHKLAHETKLPDPSKTLLVRITSMKTKYSFAECKCTVMEQPMIDVTDHTSAVKTSLPATITTYFSGGLSSKLKQNAVVRIYPPWQRLVIASDVVHILCTHYSRIVENQQPSENKCDVKHREWKMIATWRCPCLEDPTLPTSKCPANLHPTFQPKLGHNKSESIKSHDLTARNLTSNQNTPVQKDCFNLESTEHHLVEESCAATCKTVLMNILESVEASLGGNKLYFTALVQRICDKRTRMRDSDAWQGGFSLILQDQQRTMCELQVPMDCSEQPEWKTVLETGSGQCFTFYGLRAGQRTNRSRHGNLFSVMDAIWSAYNSADTCPGFCYIFKVVLGESTCAPSDVTITFTPHTIISLKDAMTSCLSRVTVIATCVYTHKQENTDIVYLYDGSCSVVPIFVEHCNVLSESRNARNKSLRIVDLLVRKGKLILDSYSSVHLLTTSDVIPLRDVTTFLTETSKAFDLVQVQGSVTGVDEDQSFSWLVCPRCKQDKLTRGTASNPFLFCTICDRGVSDPETRFCMAVYVTIANLPRAQIHVKLNENTIKKMLPVYSPEEGLDVGCVLRAKLGPIVCVLNNHTAGNFSLQEISVL